MFDILTIDIITAICARLRAVEVRALMITCRNAHEQIHPLAEVQISDMIIKSFRGLELLWVTRYMPKLGINISTDIEIVTFDIESTPYVIPINYSGRVRISYVYVYDMILRDGYISRYVKSNHGCEIGDAPMGIFSGIHFVHFINSIYRA